MKPIKTFLKDNFTVSDMSIELTSNTLAIVDSCSRIIEYNNKAISLEGNGKIVRFIGDNLELKNLSPRSAVISGKILAIEFDEWGKLDDN